MFRCFLYRCDGRFRSCGAFDSTRVFIIYTQNIIRPVWQTFLVLVRPGTWSCRTEAVLAVQDHRPRPCQALPNARNDPRQCPSPLYPEPTSHLQVEVQLIAKEAWQSAPSTNQALAKPAASSTEGPPMHGLAGDMGGGISRNEPSILLRKTNGDSVDEELLTLVSGRSQPTNHMHTP